MTSNKKGQPTCSSEAQACCKVEAIVSVDGRGQMVLPKELRERTGIHPGDKLAISSWESGGRVCCILLTKVEEIAEMVRTTLGPILGEVLKE